jgi:NTP pyrophosphatase (non-canonical NTP hydrolase)
MKMSDMGNSFGCLYQLQSEFQTKLLGESPSDSPEWFKYHMAAMVEELGELLKADKRWKTHRNTNYNKAEKLDELADCFITLFNLGLFSGFTKDEVFDAILDKIFENQERLDEKLKGE